MFQLELNNTSSRHRLNIAAITAYTGLRPTLTNCKFLSYTTVNPRTVLEITPERTIQVDDFREKMDASNALVAPTLEKNFTRSRETMKLNYLANFNCGDLVLVFREDFHAE